ncbi:amino acid adenylation domain-containing protein [Reinekea sp. G2M2-21]|uniref:amino acid adenylation domain-containing protein n=1 Tax=Reinekea sp. G2M2-21 TaxID=2788942 RepID=UPI0018AB1FF3|nr:amino acid adenylation domain-containing protein [Reinekea sp. G2M2-21]
MVTRIHEYFTQSAQRFPDKYAVVHDGDRLTYSELDHNSNRLACLLQNKGATEPRLIPFFMPKSIDAITCILGILKAGFAYVPIDYNSPKDRFEAILAATGSKVVLVSEEAEAKALLYLEGTDIEVVNVSALANEVESLPVSEALSVDLAYVLFTSGSTGVPKGVMISHQCVTDYIDWCVAEYDLNESDEISNHAPLYFDNSTFDLYTAFKTGATLHLVPERLNAVLPRLIKWLEESRITVFFCVPSVLTMLLKSRRLKSDSFSYLQQVLVAGEVLPPYVIRQWMMLYPNIRFTNMYGPTEITVDCSFHRIVDLPSPECTSIPIGKARPNMELFVRAENGQLSQQSGAKGELLVRGNSVAYGYLADEQKTSLSFIQNPANQYFYDPLYCTGDIVTIDDNLDFHFVGRIDNQIKYMGYRIELGEIESRVQAIETVLEAVVVFSKGTGDGDDFLALLVNLKDNDDLDSLTLELKSRLPSYMVPSVIATTEKDFPRTPNGKYDRKAILMEIEARQSL